LWVTVNDGRTRIRVDEVAARIAAGCWQRTSAGVGSKGPRDHDWAEVVIGTVGNEYLLIRRGLDHYQVRGWTSWHRFTALALLAVWAAASRTNPPTRLGRPDRGHRSGSPCPRSAACSTA
jgi:hypothetical protein